MKKYLSILIIVLSSLAYIPSTDAKKEPTFFRICWQEIRGSENSATPWYIPHEMETFPDGCKGTLTGSYTKEDLPLKVYISSNLPQDQRVLLVLALEWWNQRIGAEIFVVRPKDAFKDNPPDVLLGITDEPGDMGDFIEFAVTVQLLVDGDLVSSVSIHRDFIENSSLESIWNTYLHEIGHVLGLDHDPDHPESLMFNYDTEKDQSLSQTDLCALKARYTDNACSP